LGDGKIRPRDMQKRKKEPAKGELRGEAPPVGKKIKSGKGVSKGGPRRKSGGWG